MGEMITTTQANMMISSGETHNQISNEALNIIADGQVSMTNAKETITLSAHTGKLEATAKQDVNIASSTKEVEVVATNKITITAGGASITLDGADITIVAKEVTEKGGKHGKAGGGMDGLGLLGMPTTPTAYRLRFHLKNDDEVPYSYTPYIITNENTDEKFEGVTDKDGHTSTYYSSTPDGFNIHLQIEGIEYGD